MIALVRLYNQVLDRLQADAYPMLYATINYNLGKVYVDLPDEDRTTLLENAISCFQQALRFWTPDTEPLDYALVQNDLGNAYCDLPKRDYVANLKCAIQCYQEALRFWTPEVAPLGYANTQLNLGSAYLSLSTEDRTANAEHAIECYQEALRFRTPKTAPNAITQSSLGNAYRRLPIGDLAANLKRAIACYEEALRFRTSEVTPLGYAGTQTCLGLAYALPHGKIFLSPLFRSHFLSRTLAVFNEARPTLRNCWPKRNGWAILPRTITIFREASGGDVSVVVTPGSRVKWFQGRQVWHQD